MNLTQFKLHDDPEAVAMNEKQVDKDNQGWFDLDMWLKHMTMKTNYIEEDLVKSFKVFDADLNGVVNKDELRVVFMNLIGKDMINEQ